MPKIRWTNLPLMLRDHLFDRVRERKISAEDLYQLKLWRECEPDKQRIRGTPLDLDQAYGPGCRVNELDSQCAGRRGIEFPGYGSPKSSEDDSQSTTALRSPLQRTSLTVTGEFYSPVERQRARFIGGSSKHVLSLPKGVSTGW